MDINKFKKEKKETVPKITLEKSTEAEVSNEVGILTQEPSKEIDLSNTNNIFNMDETNLTENDVTKYLEYFATIGITKNKIFEILDTILTKGDVLWNFKLLNRTPVTFRLRPAWVNDELLRVLDDTPTKTLVSFTEIIGKYNLAGSLQVYDKVEVNVKTKEDLANALDYIGALPYIIKAHLIKQLSIFDRVVALATSDWALENFTLPQQEN